MVSRNKVRNRKYQGKHLPRVKKRDRVTNQPTIRMLKIKVGKESVERPCVVYKYKGKRKVHVLEDWRLSELTHLEARPHKTKLKTRTSNDIIKGGYADNLPDSHFDPEELSKGIRVEMEHTNDINIAKEIAKDHLAESPDYYKEIEKMEQHLEEEKLKNEMKDIQQKIQEEERRQKKITIEVKEVNQKLNDTKPNTETRKTLEKEYLQVSAEVRRIHNSMVYLKERREAIYNQQLKMLKKKKSAWKERQEKKRKKTKLGIDRTLYNNIKDTIKKTKNEEGYLIDGKGKIIKIKGTGKEIDPWEVRKINKTLDNNITFIHSHPSNSTFSSEDIALFILTSKIRKFGIVNKNGVIYELEKPKNIEKYSFDDTSKAQQRYKNAFYLKKTKNIENEEERRDYAINYFAKQYNLKYNREQLSETIKI